jgi:hypothetical protein
MTSKLRIPLKWGLILAVSVCVWTLLVHALGFYTVDLQSGQYADIAATILPIAAIFLAIREQRDAASPPALSMGQGVGTGLLTGLVSGPFTAVFLWIYHHYINPRWLDHLEAFERSKLAAAGASAADIGKRIAAVRESGSDASQLTGALIGTVVISLVIAVVCTVILKRKRRAPGTPITTSS